MALLNIISFPQQKPNLDAGEISREIQAIVVQSKKATLTGHRDGRALVQEVSGISWPALRAELVKILGAPSKDFQSGACWDFPGVYVVASQREKSISILIMELNQKTGH